MMFSTIRKLYDHVNMINGSQKTSGVPFSVIMKLKTKTEYEEPTT